MQIINNNVILIHLNEEEAKKKMQNMHKRKHAIFKRREKREILYVKQNKIETCYYELVI